MEGKTGATREKKQQTADSSTISDDQIFAKLGEVLSKLRESRQMVRIQHSLNR